ncbi:MAG: DUF445 family protein [Leptospiraceae bacterium]|nr:DUF445 family protein [Leptospiraceae bacterium]MDW7975460.1 DUF445 family protein [Leptospiraceae bacterium]
MKNEKLEFKQLEEFFHKWYHKFIPEKEQETNVLITTTSSRKNYFLVFLKILPWLSGFVFLITLFYDPFEGIILQIPWRQNPLYLEGVLRMLAVTGLVGYGTNYIAIRMLFHPRKKRPLLGQGLIPASKIKIAQRLGEAISKEVINPQLVVKQIKERELIKKYLIKFNQSLKETIELQEFQEDLIHVIESSVNNLLKSEDFRKNLRSIIDGLDLDNLKGIEGGLFKLYKFFVGNQEVSKKIEEMILKVEIKLDPYQKKVQEFLKKLPELINNRQENIELMILNTVLFLMERIDIKSVIVNNLLEFDELRLEKLILYSTSEQLEYIQYLGCFLGILGGFLIWIPLESFVFFVIVGFLVFFLDEFLYRKSQTQEKLKIKD